MRRKKDLRLKLYDENHLVERGSIKFTWFRFALLCVAFAAIFVGIGMGIIWFTPVKNNLPGYMPVQQRSHTEEAVIQLDSLEAVYKINQAYIDNIATILDPERPATVAEDTLSSALPIEIDSLLLPSEIELEFVRKMENAGYVIANFEKEQSNDDGEK